MSEAKRFTEQERKAIMDWSTDVEHGAPETPLAPRVVARQNQRYDATLRAVEAERDVYKRVVQKLCATGADGVSGRKFVVGQYTELAEQGNPQSCLYFGLIAEALAAVPYDPAWDDEKPEVPSGALAAGGILADIWDDEPAEDAIRRLRDGTPPPEEVTP